MTEILNHLKPLTGKHQDPVEGVCIMEILSLAIGAEWVVDRVICQVGNALMTEGHWRFRDDMNFTDLPVCTHAAIAVAAQRTWDSVGDQVLEVVSEEMVAAATHNGYITLAPVLMRSRTPDPVYRGMMAKFLPRLLRAKRTDNHRVNVRIALAAARFVEHMHPSAKTVNDMVQRWLDGDIPENEVEVLRMLLGCREQEGEPRGPAENARFAADYTVREVLEDEHEYGSEGRNAWVVQAVVCASYAAQFASGICLAPTGDMEGFLDAMLDAHEKACAEEGEMVYDPEPWEDDAIEFVDTLMGELAAEFRRA